MGLFLPFVGYVAATKDGGHREEETNKRNLISVDSFIGMIRIAHLEGWCRNVIPSGDPIVHKDYTIHHHPKNYEHKVFFESDKYERPHLADLIKFLYSEPSGGAICVVDISHLVASEPEGDTYGVSQCAAVHALLRIPVIVCGHTDDPKSLVSKFARSHGNEEKVSQMIRSALSQWNNNKGRILRALEAPITDDNPQGRAHDDKNCELKKLRTKLSVPTNLKTMEDYQLNGIICGECSRALSSHKNSKRNT